MRGLRALFFVVAWRQLFVGFAHRMQIELKSCIFTLYLSLGMLWLAESVVGWASMRWITLCMESAAFLLLSPRHHIHLIGWGLLILSLMTHNCSSDSLGGACRLMRFTFALGLKNHRWMWLIYYSTLSLGRWSSYHKWGGLLWILIISIKLLEVHVCLLDDNLLVLLCRLLLGWSCRADLFDKSWDFLDWVLIGQVNWFLSSLVFSLLGAIWSSIKFKMHVLLSCLGNWLRGVVSRGIRSSNERLNFLTLSSNNSGTFICSSRGKL